MTAEEIEAALIVCDGKPRCPDHDVELKDGSFCDRCFEREQHEGQRKLTRILQPTTHDCVRFRDEMRRKRGCKQSPSGEWLCRCGAPLADDQSYGTCAVCDAKEAKKHREQLIAASASSSPRYVKKALDRLPRFRHAHVGTPEFKASCRSRALRRFAEAYTFERGSAVLMSSSGLGKTTATVALVRRLIAEGVAAGLDIGPDDGGKTRREHAELKPTAALWRASKIVWTTAAELVRARRIHALGEGEPALIEEAREASLLVIDEVGSEPHDRDGELFALVDFRYREEAPTIITTGLPENGEKGFVARYGDAFLRRLDERGTKIEEFPVAETEAARG